MIVDEPLPTQPKHQPEPGEIERFEILIKEGDMQPYCYIPTSARTLLSVWTNNKESSTSELVHINLFLQSGSKIYTLTTKRIPPSATDKFPPPMLKREYFIPGNISSIPLILDKNGALILTENIIEKNTSSVQIRDISNLSECRESFRLKK